VLINPYSTQNGRAGILSVNALWVLKKSLRLAGEI
jgi:hypothetical protein